MSGHISEFDKVADSNPIRLTFNGGNAELKFIIECSIPTIAALI